MSKPMLKRRVVLMVAVIAMWVGVWGLLASAASKKVPAPVPETGQTQCFDVNGTAIGCAGTGQDGAIQAGVPFPTPRFTDNRDGTVTDNLTGLIWLQQANCFEPVTAVTWGPALAAANTLASGSCGLTDKSKAGDWRLPNVRELHSLIDFGFINPALSNAAGTGHWTEGDAFSSVQFDAYWSSTSEVGFQNPNAYIVILGNGLIFEADKVNRTARVWPVRGGK